MKPKDEESSLKIKLRFFNFANDASRRMSILRDSRLERGTTTRPVDGESSS